MNRSLKRITYILLIFVFLFTAVSSSAVSATDYSNIYNRMNQNDYMIAESAKYEAALYKDKTLRDMKETDYEGMTASQCNQIKQLADTILENTYGTTTISDYNKTKAFHDWIKENFYYYNGEGVVDHPAALYKMWVSEGKIKTWCFGYSSMLIALCRSQGIPARSVSGRYLSGARRNPSDSYLTSLWSAVEDPTATKHIWSQVYVSENGGTPKWIIVDCNADCYNTVDKNTGLYATYLDNIKDIYNNDYFNPGSYKLSQTHIFWYIRKGDRRCGYLLNTDERQQLKSFLNTSYNGRSNGTRINSGYNPNASRTTTWFKSGDMKSRTDGWGTMYKIYWPYNKGIYGKLSLHDFAKLHNIDISKNNLRELNFEDCPNLAYILAYSNKIKNVTVTGSPNLKLLSLKSNPLTSVTYSYNNGQTAAITATNGGTFGLKYRKVDDYEYRHALYASPKAGYKFLGWYDGDRRVSSKSTFISTRSGTFNFTAKFVKILYDKSETNQNVK